MVSVAVKPKQAGRYGKNTHHFIIQNQQRELRKFIILSFSFQS